MNSLAKERLEEIMGPPLLIPSELKGGALVTIYPHCDHEALARFKRNHTTQIEDEAQHG
jgi:hypothetical protein